MSKRRLSKQQQTRIAEKQQEKVRSHSENRSSDTSRSNCNGRVISHYGQQVDVEPLDPALRGTTVRCHQRANLPRVVTGDLVLWQEDGANSGVILALGERSNLFARPDSHHKPRPVAANIDCVLVVFATVPEAFMNLIDRYLVAIENLQLRPILVLNKIDRLEEVNGPDLDNMLSIYEDLGYETHRVSAQSGQGMSELEAALAGKTTVLVGQSGVGKSSLVNHLGLEDIAGVGSLSAGKEKGTHTTTTATLFHLNNCDLIDSPGIREFGLGQLDKQQVLDGFIELRELASHCKFRDCAHQTEPGCAIQDALEQGKVSRQRLNSYFQILLSNENPGH